MNESKFKYQTPIWDIVIGLIGAIVLAFILFTNKVTLIRFLGGLLTIAFFLHMFIRAYNSRNRFLIISDHFIKIPRFLYKNRNHEIKFNDIEKIRLLTPKKHVSFISIYMKNKNVFGSKRIQSKFLEGNDFNDVFNLLKEKIPLE